jgi:hypothetical protein
MTDSDHPNVMVGSTWGRWSAIFPPAGTGALPIVLRALGEPEPTLPPYDPKRIEPVLYEADIRKPIAGSVSGPDTRRG